jgi:hypothetical protein
MPPGLRPPSGHQDQAYGQPFGDIVYGDCEHDEQT